jgi:threonine dehydrogenase-like Zn-dependent dehydrogenase
MGLTQMKALTWHGKGDIRCESVPDPKIQHPRDAIIRVTACAVCGSDLHIYDDVIPTMERSDVLGHETMGEVVEVDILLNSRHQLFRFGKRQIEVGEIAKTIGRLIAITSTLWD